MTTKIVKVKNKDRKIAILTEQEKQVREELSKKLCSYVKFPECVYSYIKGKSVKQATSDIKSNINNFKYFMKCDIKDYFNSIDLNILIDIIKERTNSNVLSKEIEEILIKDKNQFDTSGIILGSPLSNHLSNLYLIQFDEKFNSIDNIKYYRFCDDMFFLYDDKKVLDNIEDNLKDLNLQLNKNKIFKGAAGDCVEYLGVKINKSKDSDFNVNTREEIINIFKEKREVLNGTEELDAFKEWVFNKLDKEYQYVFRYYFNEEDKDTLIEEMLDNNCYREVYIFEEILLDIEDNINMYAIFKEKFLIHNEICYIANISDTLDYEKCSDPIDEKMLKSHFDGDVVLGKRLNCNGKSNILVIDIDSKNNIKKAKEIAEKLQSDLEKRGVIAYIEFSGNKGYHVWILFNDFIAIYKLNNYIENVMNDLGIKKEAVEIIPKYNKLSETQEIIKLPLGIHPISKKKSYFLDVKSVKDMILNTYKDNEEILNELWNKVKEDFIEIYEVANNCTIIKKIIDYGILKGHMSHFNRLILTYVFPKLENGDEFIHFIMEHLDNYSHSITSKYIAKAPEYAISCKKLKDYYKDTDFICTNCKFNISGTYNSPILHSENEETILSASKNQVKDIIDEMIKLQQEKKEISLKLKKLEKKLNKIYEELGSESIEIPMGKLNKNEDKWIIEIEV